MMMDLLKTVASNLNVSQISSISGLVVIFDLSVLLLFFFKSLIIELETKITKFNILGEGSKTIHENCTKHK